jgi:hypothetical protein
MTCHQGRVFSEEDMSIQAEELPGLSTADLSRALDRLCETYEACGFAREDLICELEAKTSELRGENFDPVAISPLP